MTKIVHHILYECEVLNVKKIANIWNTKTKPRWIFSITQPGTCANYWRVPGYWSGWYNGKGKKEERLKIKSQEEAVFSEILDQTATTKKKYIPIHYYLFFTYDIEKNFDKKYTRIYYTIT